jgi:hypothetical protein
LTADEKNTLEEWAQTYDSKYHHVGWLVLEKGKVDRKSE